METKDPNNGTDRRQFLGTITAGAATLGIGSLLSPFQQLHAGAASTFNSADPDQWFNQINGKHRIVFDVTAPHEIYPFAWPRVFLLTNEKTGTPAKMCSVVVVLRHSAIGYALNSELWEKYNLGEVLKANDPATQKPATRNPFWNPAKGAYKIPGFGEVPIGINELQDSGVMFCVCDAALTVYSAIVADKMKLEATDLKKEWLNGVLPRIQVVPSGVWAVGRAQEHNCQYCFVG
jgi:intracellular sulfur oxidation DsrE/DsrF family protein